ncbi:MAG: hypothetical protein II922_04670 [Succinimonas sp.]|nr:hypothetical protein [Succinimonas sp.]
MDNVAKGGFSISDAEAEKMIDKLRNGLGLGDVKFSAAPAVRQRFCSDAELRDLMKAFPAGSGWVLFTDGLVNYVKQDEAFNTREILELEISDSGEASSCRSSLRAVLVSEDSYSVTLVTSGGAVPPVMGDEPDKAAGYRYAYACSDVNTQLKNTMKTLVAGAAYARYRVWYRCLRSAGDNSAAAGRWEPWMQQFTGFVKSGDAV